MSYRIEINKQRNKISFPTFLDQEQFDEIKIESELEEENLSTFLINYDMKISFEENIQKFEIKEVKHFFPKIINKNVFGVSIRKGRYMLIYKKRKKSLISIHYIVMFAIEIKKGLWKKWNQRVLVEKLSLLLFELNKIDINIDDRKLIDEWSNNYFQSKLLGI